MGEESSRTAGGQKSNSTSLSPPTIPAGIFHARGNPAAPVVAAEVRHDVFVLALLHHGDLLLDGRDVVT